MASQFCKLPRKAGEIVIRRGFASYPGEVSILAVTLK